MTEWAMSRRSLAASAALLAALGPLVALPASAEPAPVLVIEGKGFGHGVGMAQDGAFAMANEGSSAAKILSHFYPGTATARRTATVRVGVHESPGPVVVVLPGGGEVRDSPSGPQSPGFPVTVGPGGSVQLAFDGSNYVVTPVSGAAINRVAAAPAPVPARPPASPVAGAPVPPAPPPTGLLDPLLQALIPPAGSPTASPPAQGGLTGTVPASQNDARSGRGLWAVPKGAATVALPGSGRSYRGTVVATAAGRGLQLINEVDVEQYLRGMAEVPASWPAAALQAQAIAARTFAVRAAATGKTLCDDQRCQVYVGAGAEDPATDAAATATRGQVLTYQGALAETVYSASAGGVSATAEEGFGPGSPDLPYLQPVPYAVGDPQPWALTVPLQEAGARFGYRGEVTGARVSRTGPSGRPLEISFDGANGPMVVDGHRFWADLQLRSTLFTLRAERVEPAMQGEPLATSLSDLPSLPPGLPAATVTPPDAVESLGRAPWVGLAVLLLAFWGNAANRMARRRPSPARPALPADGPGGHLPEVPAHAE